MSIANDIQMLYIGYLGRAADEAGLEYWVNKVANEEWTVDQVALSFADQVEYQQIYGTEPSREALLKTTYQQLFNREFDSAGLDYWLNGDGKTVPNNLLVQAFINGALGSDLQILDNKLEVGNYYTDKKGDEFSYNQEQARDVVEDVNGLDSTVDRAKNTIDGMFPANHIFTLQETYSDPDYVPAQTEIYWGYNPCDPCNNGSGYNGVPVTELLSFLETITGLDFFELGLIDEEGANAFDNIANITLVGLGLADQSQDISNNKDDVENTGSQLILDFADGTQFTAEARLGTEYMQFLRDLLFYEDEDGLLHSRLFEKVVVEATGSLTGELQAIKLTPTINNHGTVETGYTTDGNDLIVAGRLELLHGAYIDGGAGTNTLEIDAKGVYAQPLALLNIQHILIENLPNIYTYVDEDYYGSGEDLIDSDYPYWNDQDLGYYSNSMIDLSRAINIETLTVTEGSFDGFEFNGQPGSLTVAGIRNGVTTTLDGGFSQNVYLHYSAVSDDDGVNLVFHNLNMDGSGGSAQLIVAHNSDTLNIESTGGGNWLHNADLGGRLSNLNITGDAHLFIENDLDPSFHDASPVTIDASANTGGVTLTLTKSQNITVMGSQGDDRIKLTTWDQDASPTNDESVVIVGGGGNNYYEVRGAETVTITDGDGNNNFEVSNNYSQPGYALPAVADVTITVGNGNNHFELGDVATAVLTAGNGNNNFDISSVNSADYTDPNNSFDFTSDITIVAGNGQNEIDVEADSYIGVVNVTVGNGGNTVNVEAATISVTAGTGADDIRVEGRDLTVSAGGSNNSITLVGTDVDYTDNVEGNEDNAGAPYASDAGAKLVIDAGSNSTVILGSGRDAQWVADDDFPGFGSLTAKEGSSITGTNLKMVVDTVADLRAADLSGITSVVLDDDASSYAASSKANDVINPDTGLPSNGNVNRAVLTLTSTQLLEIGADAFSVDGAIFNTHAYVRIIVDQTTSLTALGVDDLPGNIDLLLEVQDGVTLTMTAEQLHTNVAPQGVTLAWDGNTDAAAGKVVITGGGFDFDPFNTSDTVQTNIGGNIYYGGSLSSDFGSAAGGWYNVTVNSLVNGYDRPADAPAEMVITLDSGTGLGSIEQGAFSTWHTNLEIIGEQDINFTGAIQLGMNLGVPTNTFTIDFSQLEADMNGFTVDNFELLANGGGIYGNAALGYASEVWINLANDESNDVGFDEDDADSLVSSGVSKYVVTVIDGPSAAGSTGNTGTIKLCDTTQDLEVMAFRGNYNDTLVIEDAAWGLIFELQGGTTAKADGPTGTANVGKLVANYEWDGADAVVNLVHSVAGDTRVIKAYGIDIDNADSITINVAGSATIDAIAGESLDDLIVTATGDVAIFNVLPTLDIIDASGVTGDFAATLEGAMPAEGLTFTAAQDVTTLTLDDVSAGFHSSFTAEDAATFNIVVTNETDLAAATLTNVDSIVLGTIGSADANVVTLSIAQVLDIGAEHIVLAHPGLNGSLNVVGLGAEAFDSTTLGEGIVLSQVLTAEGDITLDGATNLEGADVSVPAGSSLTLTADQFMALNDLDGLVGLDTAVINITGLTQAHIDDGFTLAGVSHVIGTLTLAEDVNLAETTDLNDFEVLLAAGQTLGVATFEQADGLEVTGEAGSIVDLLFPELPMGEENIDVSGYDISILRLQDWLVRNDNVDAILDGLQETVTKEIYNAFVELVDQNVSIAAGTTVRGGLIFTPTPDGIELEDFTLTLNGGTQIKGGIDLAAGDKADEYIQTYLKTVTINSVGTVANPVTNNTDNIIDGILTTSLDNELLVVTINAEQDLSLGGITFEAIANADEIAVLTVTGSADVTVGTLDTTDDDVDGLNVVNNGTGSLTVGIDAGSIDATDDLSFTGTGDIILVITGAVDLRDDDLAAVSEIVLTQGAVLDLTMAQAAIIGASLFTLADGATAATLNLTGLDGEPFALADYAEGIVVDVLTIADDPVVTLHANTDLTGIDALVVPEGTILNLTAAQFQQLTNGAITGIDADGNVSTDFTVNITDLTQADVANGFDLGNIAADTTTLTLAENVSMITPAPLPIGWEGFDLNGFDINIGTFTLTLELLAYADALNITGDAGSTLAFTQLSAPVLAQIDASGFDVDFLRVLTNLVGGHNMDYMFEGLIERVVKIITNDYGQVEGRIQNVTIEPGVTVNGDLSFNEYALDTEVTHLNVTLAGGTELDGDLVISTAEKADDLLALYLQELVINSTGTEGNVISGEEANIITGDITPLAYGPAIPFGSRDNNLKAVTINAEQALIVEGSIIFNSHGSNDANAPADGIEANDDDAAVVTLTVTGSADVTLGGLDTSDDDVDGLNVVHTGTGTLALTLDAADIDQTATNTDVFSFTGTGSIALTTVGAIDLSDDVITAVDSIDVVETGALTLNYGQFVALGVANISVIDGPDPGTVIGNASLYINEYTGGAFSALTLDPHFNVVEITMADQDVTLDAGVDLTNVTKLWVQEGRTLTLTAAQFQQLKDNGAIDGVDTDGDTVFEAFNVVITDLTQADVNRDLDADGFADTDDGFSLTSVTTHGGTITITLGESEVTLGTMVDGVLVPGSESVLNGAQFELADNQTLGLVSYVQANGLDVDGGANSTIIFKYVPHTTFPGQVDASGYNVTTLKALAAGFTIGGNSNVEYSIDDLPSSVILRLYEDPQDLGFLDPTYRVVIIEEGITTPTGLIFNDWDDTDEVLTLNLTLEGDVVLNGNLSIPTRTDKDGTYGVQQFFNLLTINSVGTELNTIDGNINTVTVLGPPNTSENNLLNVVINATQELEITGTVVFNSIDVPDDDAVANLTINGTADVTIKALNTTDVDINTLNVTNNGTGVLTITGGSDALEINNTETLVFTGTGDIVLDTDTGVGNNGIEGNNLSLIDASGMSGDLDLGVIEDIDSTDFEFISGSGVTKLTLTSDALTSDTDGADNILGTDDDQPGWRFDFSDAAPGSEFHLGAGLGFATADSILDINLGANTTLYIDTTMDLSLLDLSITQVQDIVLADGAILTLTAAQASGLNIIAGPDTGAAGITARVNIIDLGDYTDLNTNGNNDDAAELLPYDFSGIAANIAGVATLFDNDVTMHQTTDLGFFTIQLDSLVDDGTSNLSGQTIRFATVAQAERTVTVVNDVDGTGNGNSTNVVWLFDNITAPVNTSGYFQATGPGAYAIGRLWMSADLINNEGGDVEQLFTTLPLSILRVDFADVTELNILLLSAGVDRVVEFVHFSTLGNLTFSDVGLDPIEHVESLTLNMGGEVTLGNLILNDDLLATVDPASVVFTELNLNSKRALHTDALLASEFFVNDNDGIDEVGEHVQPDAINTIGNIGVGANLDLLVVNINTFLDVDPDVDFGVQANAGAALDIGTITYGARTPATPTVLTAVLDVTGDNDVTIDSVIVTDTDITGPVTVDTTGFTATLTAPGTSPGIVLGSHIESLVFTNGGVEDAAATITITADDAPATGNETMTVNYTLDGVAGSLIVDLSAVDVSNADLVAAAVAAALNNVEGISATSALGVVSAVGIGSRELVFEAGAVGGTTTTLAYTVTIDSEVPSGTITLGTSTNAGVYGPGLSVINAAQYGGTLNLGILALFDGTNDDSTPLTPANDGLTPAFLFTAGTGVTTATLGKDPDSAAVPTLAAGSEWIFDYTSAAAESRLTITDEVEFQVPVLPATDLPTLTLRNVDLYIDGDVDLTEVDLNVDNASDIFVPAGNTLTLTLDQIAALTAIGGISIFGEGTVELVGEVNTDLPVAQVLVIIQTVGVDLSQVTDTGVAVPQAFPLTIILNPLGAVDDDGEATGFDFLGTQFNDFVVASIEADTLNGAQGDDLLIGSLGDDTFLVTSGTDTIYDLTGQADDSNPLTDEDNDVLVVSAGATATTVNTNGTPADTSDDFGMVGSFYATAATSNAGTAIIAGIDNMDKTIDMSLAAGPNGYSIIGGNDDDDAGAVTTGGHDILIGSAFADTINGGNSVQEDADTVDALTGNAGNDIFVFDVSQSNPIVLTEAPAGTVGSDLERWDFDPQAFGTATGFAVDNDGNQALTVLFRNNATSTSFTINDDASINFASGDDLAAQIVIELAIRGVAATYDAVTDLLTLTGTVGQSVEILSLTPVAGAWADPTPGNDTPVELAGYDAANDVAQISNVTVGTGGAATAVAGEIYSISVELAEGSDINFEYTAVGGETETQLAGFLAAGLNGLGGVEFTAGSAANVVTITDIDADNGGFTLALDNNPGISGTGASALGAGAGVWANTYADVITDFTSGQDKIALVTAGTNSNYNEGAEVADYATAYADAAAAMTGSVIYYLTSATDLDGAGPGTEGAGLLFFDANGDNTIDGVIALMGVTSANFDETDIIAA